MSLFYEKVESLTRRVEENNNWRQRESFNLIPSEMTPSLLVKMCEISDPSGRYAEHRTMKGSEVYFYQGTDFIRDVEEELREEMRRFFGCTEVELRPVSGQMANEVVFKAMVRFLNRKRAEGQPMRKMSLVMNNDLTKGGHLSSQPMGALFNYVKENPQTGKENVINFPVLKDNPYKLDVQRLAEILNSHKPELLIFGKSMFIYQEPIKVVAEIIKDWEVPPVIMYDMAHVLGLYGAFQKPLEEGANVITGSTHKTSRLRPLWLDIKSRAFPGSTSNHHLGTLLGLLVAAYEMNEFREDYQEQVRLNAKALAKALKDKGIQVEGDPKDGFTETHQVLIRVKDYGNGQEIARRLEENNIITNYQALPDDKTFLEPSGIRMGAQEMTRFGMEEKDFDELAGYIAEVVVNKAEVKDKVRQFRQKFLKMKFCLSAEKALPLAARIIKNILPHSDYLRMFIDNLEKNLV